MPLPSPNAQTPLATRVYRALWPASPIALAVLTLALIFSPFDHAVSDALYLAPALKDNPHLQYAAELASYFGKGDVAVFLTLLAGVSAMRKKATAALLALVITLVLVFPLKGAVGRERPRGQSSASFPSADTATISAVAFTLGTSSPPAMAAGAAVAGLVALSRVYYGAHYPSDVLAGMAFGVLAGGIALYLCRRRALEFGPAAFLFFAALFLSVFGVMALYPKLAAPTRLGFAMPDFLKTHALWLFPLLALRHFRLARSCGFDFRRYLRLL